MESRFRKYIVSPSVLRFLLPCIVVLKYIVSPSLLRFLVTVYCCVDCHDILEPIVFSLFHSFSKLFYSTIHIWFLEKIDLFGVFPL